ncbi:MAG: hypothetical protein JWM37_166 [Candidatus Saccharibacteria bacterium]|nr:hypothetical protein [Candidatus Saccharibacteria bacterium]
MTTTLTGENSAAIAAKLSKITTDFIAAHGDLGYERLDGEEADFNQLREATHSLPFLAERKLVVLRAPGQNKQFAEAIEAILADVPDTTDLVIVEPKLDKRSVYFKVLKQKTTFVDNPAMDERALARWLTEAAKAEKGNISQTDALFLVERVGADQQLLKNELAKLMLFDPHVTRQTIELLSEAAPQSTIFQLVEAAFAGRTARALELYDEQRSLKVEPPQIVAMLAWQLHVLALLVMAGDRPADTVAREAKLSPYTVRKSTQIARQLTPKRIRSLIHQLLAIDIRSKQAPIDSDEALKHYILILGQ